MKKTILTVLIGVLGLLFSNSISAQTQQRKLVYEITVMGLTCDGDAAKLDQMMLSKKGIVSSSTSFTAKRVKVVVDPLVNISALRNVIIAAGFEMSEENLSQTEQQ